MAFTSAPFLALTAASVLLYYLVPKRAQWCVLLLASLAFYLAGSVRAVVWLAAITAVTWGYRRQNIPISEGVNRSPL